MDGVTTHNGYPPIAYFTEVVPGEAKLRLAAAVVWRGVPTPAARYGGGPLGWVRGVRHRLWLRLGPLGADVSVAGRPLFGGTWGAARGISSAAAAPGTEPLAYYDDGTHVLRVLGRVVVAPPGRTLVALVDASGRRASWPRILTRVVSTPPMAVQLPDFVPPSNAGAVSYFVGGEQPTWDAALRADPVVGGFLDRT